MSTIEGTRIVICITPKVQEKHLDTGEYLLHELSHAAFHQNQSWLGALRVSRQRWFAEGLAVSFDEQKSCFTPQEFLDRVQKLELGPIIDPDQRAAAGNPFDMRLGYQTWRYFPEHLIDTRLVLPICLGESPRQDQLFHYPVSGSIGTLDVADLHPLAPRRDFALESISEQG